jgi:hypothetical protein
MSRRRVAARPSRSTVAPFGVMQIRAVQCIRFAEHSCRLFERDAMLRMVDRGLPRVPLEHTSAYTKLARGAARARKVFLEEGLNREDHVLRAPVRLVPGPLRGVFRATRETSDASAQRGPYRAHSVLPTTCRR